MDCAELLRKAALLQASPTMQKIVQMTAELSSVANQDKTLKAAFCICLTDLVVAVDNGEIEFNSAEAGAMFHALLALSLKATLGDIEFQEMTRQ